jgi:hypothetical protein
VISAQHSSICKPILPQAFSPSTPTREPGKTPGRLPNKLSVKPWSPSSVVWIETVRKSGEPKKANLSRIPQPPSLEEISQKSSKTKSTKKITIKPKKQTRKSCPEGKILNPLTNRCINKKGALAMKLIKKGLI